MLNKTTLDFLKKLRKNNNKEWVDAHRETLNAAREEFKNLTEKLIIEIGKFDKDAMGLEAGKCMFRQNRDIRFSADKSPYKTSFGAFINKGGKKTATAGYYIHAEPGNCFVAAGLWMPEKEQLAAVRQEIDYNAGEFLSLLKERNFRKYFPDGPDAGHATSRPPKGYDDSNPAIKYLKLKSFTVSCALPDAEMMKANGSKGLAAIFRSAFPFVHFLNRALD